MSEWLCDVCSSEEAIETACVPGVPMSVAYGERCLKEGAHPYWALRVNVACCGGVEQTSEAFLDLRVFRNGQYTTLRDALAEDPLTKEELFS